MSTLVELFELMKSRAADQAELLKATDVSEQTVPEERHVIIALIAQHLGMPAELTSPQRGVGADVITPPTTHGHTHSHTPSRWVVQPCLCATLLCLYGFG